MATLDCDKDYVLKITSIQDDIKTDEEVVIQNKKACDGGTQGTPKVDLLKNNARRCTRSTRFTFVP